MYSLILCNKINDDCVTVTMDINVDDINVVEHTNESIVRYGLLLVIVDVVICSYLHRYNISGLQPFSTYSLSIRAINDIDSANFSEPVALILVKRSEITQYHCVSVANVLLFVTVEAAVQNLILMPLNNSEVLVTWDVDPDLFELGFYNVEYFLKSELQKAANVTDRNYYQISDLIPGETYTVHVTAYYSETTGSRLSPAVSTEGTVTLDKIGMLYIRTFNGINKIIKYLHA